MLARPGAAGNRFQRDPPERHVNFRRAVIVCIASVQAILQSFTASGKDPVSGNHENQRVGSFSGPEPARRELP
jgi:hypothetical protein